MATVDQKIDEDVAIAQQLCGYAIQKYIAYLDDQEVSDMFDNVIIQQGMKFNKRGTIYWLSTNIVDKDWMFPIDECGGKTTKDGMVYFINNTSALYQIILQGIALDRFKHPERFIQSKLVCDPKNTTLMAFNPTHGRTIRDMPKRIGFEWLHQ